MEYLMVKSAENHDVMIDGIENGRTNELIILGEGCIEIVVDSCEPIVVEIEDTTEDNPMVVEV